jgi:hypothetical protein
MCWIYVSPNIADVVAPTANPSVNNIVARINNNSVLLLFLVYVFFFFFLRVSANF